MENWDRAKDDYKISNEGVVIVVFRSHECVLQTIEELDIVKERLVGKPQFDRLNIKDWEMQEGIPSADIIWYNVSKLLLDNTLSRFKAFVKPLLTSMLITFAILALERACELLIPFLAPFLIQLTTTAIAVQITYHTPYIVYQALIVEPHWLRTTRDYLYTVRLFTIQCFNILVAPLLFNLVCWYLQKDNIGLTEALSLAQGFYLR